MVWLGCEGRRFSAGLADSHQDMHDHQDLSGSLSAKEVKFHINDVVGQDTKYIQIHFHPLMPG